MKQKLTMTLACLFLLVGSALAQTKVTGVVTSSEDGQPVTGVVGQGGWNNRWCINQSGWCVHHYSAQS